MHWETSDAWGQGVEVSFVDATSTRTPWDVAVIQFCRRPERGRICDRGQGGRLSARMTAPEGRFRVVVRSSGMRSRQGDLVQPAGCPCAASPDYPKGHLQVLVSSPIRSAKRVVVRDQRLGPARSSRTDHRPRQDRLPWRLFVCVGRRHPRERGAARAYGSGGRSFVWMRPKREIRRETVAKK